MVGVWKLIMEPAPTPEDAPLVFEDLALGNAVSVGISGMIGHSRNCGFAHDQLSHHWSSIRLSNRQLSVELEYPASLNGIVGPVHPRFRVISPGIIRRHHPHLFHENTGKDQWACPITPHGTAWNWEHGGTLEYLDQCALWLLKSEVWVTTGGEVFPWLGHWLGPDSGHQILELIKDAKLDGPCRCGKGTAFGDCCYSGDLRRPILTR